MSNEEIIEGNKLIVEFMGLKLIKESELTEDTNVNEYVLYPRYHREWNWLMPVCKKIIDMYKDMRQDIFSALTKVNIEATWKAVVAFILFWNDESQTKLKWSNIPFPYNPMPKGRII